MGRAIAKPTFSIYVQAGLIDKADFDAGHFDRAILSEVDTIQFVPNEYPDIIDGQRVETWDADQETVQLPTTPDGNTTGK